MSKSKKNTIDPQNIIKQYGADAVRFFILSDSPPERDVQWSDEGMKSSYKFIQKFWILNEQILDLCKINSEIYNEELDIFTNQSINKINQALEKFRYNVIIATFHEIYSYFKKIIENKSNFKNLKNNFEKILLIMMPVIPHLANECLEKLNNYKDVKWPNVEEKYLLKETNDIVVQVNGKKRGIISAEKDTTENDIINQIKNKQLIDKYLNGRKLIKTIYVKNRLINYIIK
jgi:leucyl-tRNA synthetase